MEYVGKLYGKVGGKYIEVADTEGLREENARLRAAVLEMKRMLPVLEDLRKNQGLNMTTLSKDDLNNYRLALKTALAKRSKP